LREIAPWKPPFPNNFKSSAQSRKRGSKRTRTAEPQPHQSSVVYDF